LSDFFILGSNFRSNYTKRNFSGEKEETAKWYYRWGLGALVVGAAGSVGTFLIKAPFRVGSHYQEIIDGINSLKNDSKAAEQRQVASEQRQLAANDDLKRELKASEQRQLAAEGRYMDSLSVYAKLNKVNLCLL